MLFSLCLPFLRWGACTTQRVTAESAYLLTGYMAQNVAGVLVNCGLPLFPLASARTSFIAYKAAVEGPRQGGCLPQQRAGYQDNPLKLEYEV